ncbi:uncharacterized protein LOC143046845 [Mytilus galloprovincialis]|uniref:uncharacterized protein LOC143046845 n=1 Tax=Mytilus galloprovincialis TaxID=29158 RepID=UPI003F7BCA37
MLFSNCFVENISFNISECNSSVDISVSLPAGISCYLSDTCTGIDCCIQVDKLGLSVNTYVVLDTCHNTFTVGVENYKHTTTMLDIDYGEIQTFSLNGFVRVSYKIHEFFHERMFVVSVNISVCYEANGPCAVDLKILENTKLPIPLCDFNQEIPGFSLAAWLDNNEIDLGSQLQSYYVDRLMEELGIAGYLLNPQCEVSTYQADTNRWNAGSCNADLSLPTLPSNMACQLPDYCTGIQCCLYIPLLDISVEFHVLIDICNLKLSIGLENLVINESLSDYNFNTQNNISLGNIIKLSYSIKDLKAEEKLSFDLTINICLERDGDCIYNYIIFEDYKISKQPCDWTGGFAVPNFTLSSWLNDHDLLSDASELSDLMASKLLEDLGIAEYLQEPSCNAVTDTAFSNVQSNGWNSACPSVVLPDLPDDVVCHLDSTCTSVTCCAHVGLINRNIHFFLTVDPCYQTFTIGIEKYQFEFYLYETDFDLQKQFHVGRVLEFDYKISDMGGERVYYIDLSIKICFNDGGPCLIQANIFSNTKLQKTQCSLQKGFLDPDWSLSNWYKHTGFQANVTLTTDEISQLMLDLGLSKFLYDNKCDYTDPESVFINAYQGWTSDCPDSKIQLSDLPDYLTCYLDSTCMGIQCCWDVDFISRSFHSYLTVDTCNYILKFGVEKLEFEVTLDDYEWGEWKQFDLYGVVSVRYMIDDLPAQHMYLFSMTLSLCWESDRQDCDHHVIFNNVLLPKPNCNWNKPYNIPGCQTVTKADIVFVVDESGSVGEDNFRDTMAAIADTIDTLVIREDLIRVGMTLFEGTGTSRTLFDLNSSYNKSEIRSWLSSADYRKGATTDIADAFQFACEEMFLIVKGERRDAENYLVLLTDGKSDRNKAIDKAALCSSKNVRIITVGIGSGIDVDLLNTTAYQPDYFINTEYSELNTTLPELVTKSVYCSKDFSLAKFVSDSGLSTLDSFAVSKLMDYLGVSEYLLSEQCDMSRLPYKTSVNGWTDDCSTKIPDKTDLSHYVVCYIPHTCTSIDCCVNLPGLHRTIHASVDIDTCNYKLTVGIEKVHLEYSLVDYEWGLEEKYNLFGIFSLVFTIEDVKDDNKLLVTMDISVCMERAGPCEVILHIFKDTRLPKPACYWKTEFLVNDFSLENFLFSKGLSSTLSEIPTEVLLQLSNKLGIASFYIENQCNREDTPYIPNKDGWNNDCLKKGSLPALSNGTTCHLSDDCTGVTCCTDVDLLSRSISTSLKLDPCEYTLQVQIENLVVNISLVDYQFGKQDGVYLFGVIRLDYDIEDLRYKRQYVVNLHLSVCFEVTQNCTISIPVLTNTILPKSVCDWKSNFIDPEFTFTKFIKEEFNLNTGDKLTDYQRKRLMDSLGLSEFVMDVPCSLGLTPYLDSGWNNDCDTLTSDLPLLPGATVCHILETCTSVSCCFSVDKIGQSFQASVDIDPCRSLLTVSIEKFTLQKNLLDFQWGTPVEMWLFGLLRIELAVNDLESEGTYLVDMTLKACLDADVSIPCYQSIVVFKDYKLPISVCPQNNSLTVQDFSMESWMSDNGLLQNVDPLPQWAVLQLIQMWGISRFVADNTCSDVLLDTSSDCSLSVPVLPDWLFCSIPSACNGIECCVDLPRLNKSVAVSIKIESCRNTLQLQIGQLITKIKLNQFVFDKDHTFSLFGVVKIIYKIVDIGNQYQVDLNMSVCYSDAQLCDYNIQLWTDTLMNESNCDLAAGFLDSEFSLNTWLGNRGLDLNSSLSDVVTDDLIMELGLSDYMDFSDKCNLTSTHYMGRDNEQDNETSSNVTLPSLPKEITCYISPSQSEVSCCVEVDILKRSLQTILTLDTCTYKLTVRIENLHHEINLLNYQWGRTEDVRLHGVFRLRFTLYNIPSEKKFLVDASIKICLEATDVCLQEYTVLNNADFLYSDCNSTDVPFGGLAFEFWKPSQCTVYNGNFSNGCTDVPAPMSSLPGCKMSSDCHSVECCTKINFMTGTRNVYTTYQLTQCDEMVTSIERQSWTKTGLDSLTGSTISEKVNGVFDMRMAVVESSSTLYKVTLSLKICYLRDDSCKTLILAEDVTLKKPECSVRRKRRKRDASFGFDPSNLKGGLKKLYDDMAASPKVKDFLQQAKDYEDQLRAGNLKPSQLKDDESITGPMSTLKALGFENPTTIGSLWNVDYVVGATGAKAIKEMMSAAKDIAGRKDQAYVVGQGLSNVGVDMLGEKLAKMTIGEIKDMLDLRNLDPVIIVKLFGQLKDLAKALLTEFIDKLLEDPSSILDQFDVEVKGDFSFPRQNIRLIPPVYKTIPIGPLKLRFEFGATAYFGMGFEVGIKILGMKGFASIIPFGGAKAYGSISICFWILCGRLQLDGYIMNTRFPSTAEIAFFKFPIDVGLSMYLQLIPLEMRLSARVTLEIRIFWGIKFTITLFKRTIWRYRAPSINKKIIDNTKKEEDLSPPELAEITTPVEEHKKAKRSTASCYVRQTPYLDYTDPEYEISIRAEDDKSLVRLYLNIGTVPGGFNVLYEYELGGPSTIIREPLKSEGTGVPIYFTLIAENNSGQRSEAFCSLPTYDVTLPGGRFQEEFLSTSNPEVLRAYVTVYEDSELETVQLGAGYGKGIFGDQMVLWDDVNLDHNQINDNLGEDPFNKKVLEQMFTGSMSGRLVGPKSAPDSIKSSPGDCARACADLPQTKCMSFNYDFDKGVCELMEAIEGHHYSRSKSGVFEHYERLGIGKSKQFVYENLQLQHNKLYYFNLRLVNVLGYESIINTQSIIVDTTTPETGYISNKTADYLEILPCLDLIPGDRPDWKLLCKGVHPKIQNHRLVVDGPGSQTVFNGPTPMFDLKFTRANKYMSVNWDGFIDRESGIMGYTVLIGLTECKDDVHVDHDPHKHLFDKSQWTHSAMISPPSPATTFPDGQYFTTVRAFNDAKYGGPLTTTVCHSIPLTIDTSRPEVYDIYGIEYDEDLHILRASHLSGDPHSGLVYNDLCLGHSERDCDEMDWKRMDHSPDIQYAVKLTDGVRIWVKIKVINGVDLSKIGVADQSIIVDKTPPVAGQVLDGSVLGEDMQFTKDQEALCSNWKQFYDAESGISVYMIGISSTKDMNNTGIAGLTEINKQSHMTCLPVTEDLEHGETYYTIVWAYNGGITQQKVAAISNGVTVDLTAPESGEVIDGVQTDFTDLQYSASTAKVGAQWEGYHDPESGIQQYGVQVEISSNNTDHYEVVRDWITFSKEINSIEWVNFNLQHKDNVKVKLRTINTALNSIINETDGFVVDLTSPVLVSLGDGTLLNEDITFQSDMSSLSSNFEFIDEESGLDHYKVQIYQHHEGLRSQILPAIYGEWLNLGTDVSINHYTQTGLSLHQGGVYSMRVGAVNKAGFVAAFETDGVVIDTTPPIMHWMYVGVLSGRFETVVKGYVWQADTTGIKVVWAADDHESGITKFRVAVGTTHGGTDILSWTAFGTEKDIYIPDLTLQLTDLTKYTPVYYVSVKSENGAGQESNPVTSTPIVVVDDDKPGMYDRDTVSGQESSPVTSTPIVVVDDDKPGMYDRDTVSGQESSPVTSTPIVVVDEDKPGMYDRDTVSGQESSPVTSTPIVVVDEDKPGLVIDGPEGTDGKTQMLNEDLDYQLDFSTTTLQFRGFESHLHGVVDYEWAVGTTPGGEDVMSYTTHGLIHSEEAEVVGNGISSSGFAQANLQLKPEIKKYYSSVRAVTNDGNVLEAVSDGFTVDTTPPVVTLDRLTDKDATELEDGSSIYQKTVDSLSALWHYSDEESGIQRAWFSVGTYPFGEDVAPVTEVNITPNLQSSLPLSTVAADTSGKPNIISVYSENKAGSIGKVVFGSVVIDASAPNQGDVTCPEFVGAKVPVKCSWTGFHDSESPIEKFLISLGSEEGFSDIFQNREVDGHTFSYLINDADELMTHEKSYYVTVTAVNTVGLQSYSFSRPVAIDTTPPNSGKVVDLHTTYRMDVTDNAATVQMNAKACTTDEECDALDATCSESLTSVSVTWQPFIDEQSGITGYEIAVGTTSGGGQIKPFFNINTEANYYTVTGLTLNGLTKVYVSIKGTNGAGLSSVSSSNGLYLSYLSQGLPPLSHIGIADVTELSNVDIDFQESFDTYRASWDVSGDPCPVIRFDWLIQRLDGKVVMDWLDMGVKTSGMNDELEMLNGELYYSLLRVTNALNYTYMIRSNGVTVKQEPLIPGKVFDGDLLGYDLNFINSKSMVMANWDGFGLPVDAQVDVISGNQGVHEDNVEYFDKNQAVEFYEVALGTDRRFSKTRDNIVPFTNIEKDKNVTFYDLDLVPGTGMYYFTVKAYSASHSVAIVTSNGFYVGFGGKITPGNIVMGDIVTTDTYLEIQFDGFFSTVDMLMYYVAVANNSGEIAKTNCKRYIAGGKATEEEKSRIFNVFPVTNINQNTFYKVENLDLKEGESYVVWVLGIDKSGECSLVSHTFMVDTTPPIVGELTSGPDYNMNVTFTPDSTTLTVTWEGFSDPESDIASYKISLWNKSSCSNQGSEVLMVDWITLGSNYSQYMFTELQLQENTPYITKLMASNNAGLSVSIISAPVLYDSSVPTAGHVVDGTDFKDSRVWFGSSSSITGTFLHLANAVGPSCPVQTVSMKNDKGWKKIQQIGFKDPSGQQWSLTHRQENIQNLLYDDVISIKLARDVHTRQMFTGAYIRPAEFENGGIYQVSVKAASGEGIPVTGIMLWDGPADGIASYNYITEDDWTLYICDCCQEDPAAETCSFCNCSSSSATTTPTITTTDTVTTTQPPYQIVKNPKETVVTQPVDTELPVAQAACGVQILTGNSPQVVTWCQAYNNTQRLMKTIVDLSFDPSTAYHNYKIEVSPQRDDEVNINWCIKVFVDDEELTEICGIEPPSTSAKLVLHVWNRNNYVPDISDLFNVFSAKAYFEDLIIPPKIGNKCRYGDPFRGGTNPVIKYEAGIGTEKLQTDVVPYREIYRPCVPCNTQCSLLNCQSDCDLNQHTVVTFTLNDLDLEPFVVAENDTGHEYNKTVIYYETVRVVLGSGLTAVASSGGFYIDLTPPIFDPDAMLQIYIDVSQGEFRPVKYQASNDTIKAYWYCYDTESLIKDNKWAIGTSIGSEDIQQFVSIGVEQIAINSSLEGMLKNNHTYFVSIICENGAGQVTQWNDEIGVIILLDPPDVELINATVIGAEKFDQPVTPSDSKRGTDPGTIGFSFTISEDESVKRYDICLGSSDNKDDIFPCTYVSVNMSGTILIKNGSLYLNQYKLYDLHELRRDQSSSSSNTFHMEPGRTLFITLRACNDAYLCSNKSLGTVTMMDDKAVMKTSLGGEPLEVEYDMSSSRRKRRSIENILVITTPDGLASGQSVLMEPLDSTDLTAVYDSVSSTQFQPYIVNPSDTMNLVDRLLYRRLSSSTFSFTLVPIGHLPMPGPVNITYFDSSSDRDQRVMLTHWNPGKQQWELTSKTCGDNNDTEILNVDGSTTTMVCRTRDTEQEHVYSLNSRKKRSTSQPMYLSEETQFSLSIVSTTIYNTPPRLVSPEIVTMEEDSGTLQYFLEAIDDEDDTIVFYLEDTDYVMGTPTLTTNGLLMYTPCTDCAGTEYIHILLTEHQTDISAASSNITIIVHVTSKNEHPGVFLTQYGSSVLFEDKSEPVVVYLEQKTNYSERSWSDQFTALFGAYDKDVNDVLTLMVSQPDHGSVTVSEPILIPPEIEHCLSPAPVESEPCGNFSQELPNNATEMSWIYITLTYIPQINYYGYDYIKLYVMDDRNSSSEVVSIQIAIMESPCQNKGACQAKDNSSYPCDYTHRAVNFDLYYNCVCSQEFTGLHCEEDVDECLSKPCPDSYTCTNKYGGYDCSCPDCGLATWAKAVIGLSVILVCVIIVAVIVWCRKKIRNSNKWARVHPAYHSNLKQQRQVSFVTTEDNKNDNIRLVDV